MKERTRNLLERLAKDPAKISGRVITPPLTHQQMADMIGTSRETVTRVVKELKSGGWLTQDGKRYLIPADDKDDLPGY